MVIATACLEGEKANELKNAGIFKTSTTNLATELEAAQQQHRLDRASEPFTHRIVEYRRVGIAKDDKATKSSEPRSKPPEDTPHRGLVLGAEVNLDSGSPALLVIPFPQVLSKL